MKIGLEHRSEVYPGERTTVRARDKATCRVAQSPLRKSSQRARTAGERTRTQTKDPEPPIAVLGQGLTAPSWDEMDFWTILCPLVNTVSSSK